VFLKVDYDAYILRQGKNIQDFLNRDSFLFNQAFLANELFHDKNNFTPPTEAAVFDVLWGGNRELTGKNQEVWPHAPYVMQS
jgi:hypothetical protein